MSVFKTISLRVEAFGGEHINDVTHDMCELANKLGLRIIHTFNGVEIWAHPCDDYLLLSNKYRQQLDNPNKFKIARI